MHMLLSEQCARLRKTVHKWKAYIILTKAKKWKGDLEEVRSGNVRAGKGEAGEQYIWLAIRMQCYRLHFLSLGMWSTLTSLTASSSHW